MAVPWEVRKGFGRCGPGKWAVVKSGTDEVEGCHTTEASAKRQQAALYASEPSARQELLPVRTCRRTYEVEDFTIRSEGSGRVAEAYFAVFAPIRAEVVDQDGHYLEENARTLLTKTLAERGLNIPVFYNHARTLDGTPSGELSIPIGKPLEIKADGRGVFSVVRYLDNPLADSILDGIRHRVINGMSYSGRFIKSTKSYPQGRGRSRLPLIVRHEAALREFGPTAIPQFPEAEILGTRAQQFLRMLLEVQRDPTALAQLGQEFEGLTTPDPEPEASPPDTPEEAGAVEQTEEPQPHPVPVRRQHSARSLAQRIRAARVARGIE
jgi:HK97 family phage prohead protease